MKKNFRVGTKAAQRCPEIDILNWLNVKRTARKK